ncbi:hypothetical protein BDR04DRAFT_1118829 [Suillus decipiens]|nr:hypothetical protein BDR04DRAFT_1118829 [Suillus decipiens]
METDELLPTDNGNAFTRKEDKTLNELMSVFHVLDLKKQRAQAEVDMFSEAIILNAELEFTDDGTSSGKVTILFPTLVTVSIAIQLTSSPLALSTLQLSPKWLPEMQDKFILCQVPCYMEGEDSLRRTLDPLVSLNYAVLLLISIIMLGITYGLQALIFIIDSSIRTLHRAPHVPCGPGDGTGVFMSLSERTCSMVPNELWYQAILFEAVVGKALHEPLSVQ